MVSTIADIDIVKIAPKGSSNVNGTSKDDLLFLSGQGIAQAGDGNDIVYGGTGNDTLRGDAGDDLLYGGAGNDTLHGGVGSDILLGGAGHDVLYGGVGNDILSGGDGADKFFFDAAAGNDILTDLSFAEGDVITLAVGTVADMGSKQLTISSQAELEAFLNRSDVLAQVNGTDLIVTYGAGQNTLTLQGFGAQGGPNVHINGNSLNNLILGSQDGNLILSGGGDDTVFSGAGGGKIQGGAGDDLIVGGAGADILGGQDGGDTIFGGAGNDAIGGGRGNDILTGGSGSDTFNFNVGDGQDTITDFSAGDKLNLYGGYVAGQQVLTITSVDDLYALVNSGAAQADVTGDSVNFHFDGGEIRFVGIDWVQPI